MDNLVTFSVLPIAAIVLSLFLAYFPRIKERWEAVEPGDKQTWMLLLYAAVVLGAWGLSQAGIVDVYPKFDVVPWYESLKLVGIDYIAALVANVAAYKSTNYIGSRG